MTDVARIDSKIVNLEEGGLAIVGEAVDISGMGVPNARLLFEGGPEPLEIITDFKGSFTVRLETPKNLRIVPYPDDVGVKG